MGGKVINSARWASRGSQKYVSKPAGVLVSKVPDVGVSPLHEWGMFVLVNRYSFGLALIMWCLMVNLIAPTIWKNVSYVTSRSCYLLKDAATLSYAIARHLNFRFRLAANY